MSDMMDSMKGKAKEMGGKVSDNKKMELEGKAQDATAQAKDQAKDKFEDIKN
jgi:uncharacterized protein YjbJ (UPF0337 family)